MTDLACSSAAKKPASEGVYRLPVATLSPADSPRLDGEDAEHVRALANSSGLPPIVVHRESLRVVDGMHRLRAAVVRGDDRIDAVFFDGDVDAAFLHAVRVNVANGLPLRRRDREAAATRIASAYPDWSDRALAAATGLSSQTVKRLRECSTDRSPQPNSRVGRDGRRRPLDTATGRKLAADVIDAHPEASLRAVARAAGISPATAKDVRDRLRNGEDAVLVPRPRTSSRPDRQDDAARSGEPLHEQLREQPDVLAWLRALQHALRSRDRVVTAVPPHSTYAMAEVARSCAADMRAFAERLENEA